MTAPISLYNTLSRSIEKITPLDGKTFSLYTCGPTVYDHTHIGHMRKYTMDDVLKRMLLASGYNVRHVMNITDVGHLTDDADTGDDKLEKKANISKKTVYEVAQMYTDEFINTMHALNLMLPQYVKPPVDAWPVSGILVKASEHIDSMIRLIQKLESQGHTYSTSQAVYFDTSTFPTYGALSGQKLNDKKTAAREDVYTDPEKKNPADFALWFFRKDRFADHSMHWESLWGDGFPGWHIECSAMSMQYLGDTIDIHTGGIDHIPVHHENEIAQSEAATGKKFVQCWVHHAFLQVEGEKMSKSKNNFFTLQDIVTKGYDPMALRLLFLQTHYRKPLDFSWKSLDAAQSAWDRITQTIGILKAEKPMVTPIQDEEFLHALCDDLNTPEALAVMWKNLDSATRNPEAASRAMYALLKLGFILLVNFTNIRRMASNGNSITIYTLDSTPKNIIEKTFEELIKRIDAREQKNFARADDIRNTLTDQGIVISDTHSGTVAIVNKKSS